MNEWIEHMVGQVSLFVDFFIYLFIYLFIEWFEHKVGQVSLFADLFIYLFSGLSMWLARLERLCTVLLTWC